MTVTANTENIYDSSFTHPESQPRSWEAVFFAGLPHILMGLLIGIGKFLTATTADPSQTTSTIAGLSLMCLVVVVLFFAWRRGWPLWSASWYGYGTWTVMVLISFVIAQLELEEDWRYSYILFVGWVGLCIVGYYYVLSKDRLKALLAVAFLFPMGILFLEFVPDAIEGWLAIGLGLLTALTAGAIVRLGDFSIGLGLTLGVNFVIGLALAYVGEYQASDLPPGIYHAPSSTNFVELLTLYLILTFGLIVGPFFLRSLVRPNK